MMETGKVEPLVPSDEGDKKGLELARAQGEALTRTLKHMTDEIAHDGREVQHGKDLVAYAVEEAEGMYVPSNSGLEWQPPKDENAHIEIAVRDAADGRLIPGLKAEVSLTAPDGNAAGTHEMPLLWHPYPYHYGRNWRVPGDGNDTLRVRGAARASLRRRRAWMGCGGRSRFFWSPCKLSDIQTGKIEALRELKIELRQEVER